MLGRMLFAALAGGAGLCLLAGGAFAGSTTIDKPMFNGKRLDWCAGWTSDCGKPAADAYCKTQGYAEAANFKRDPHIGSSSPTRVISTGAICDFAHCDGFQEITCQKLPTVDPEQTVDAEVLAVEGREPEAAGATATATEPAQDDAAEGQDALAASAGEAIAGEVSPATETAAAAPDPTDDAAPVTASEGAEVAEGASEVFDKPVQLASADAVPPQAAMAAVRPPTPPLKPVRVAVSVRPGPVTKAFYSPFFKGKRLDWCRGWKDTCGQSTADDFCKFKGFARAVAFAPDPHIGRRQPTRQIATGMVCDQEMCDGFRIITCEK